MLYNSTEEGWAYVQFHASMFTTDRPHVEWKKDKKVPVAWLVKARQDEAFCRNLQLTIWMQKHNEFMAETGPWKCQGLCGGEIAKFLVSRPHFKIDESPPLLIDPICIPVCGLPECSLRAKQMEEGIFNHTMKMLNIRHDMVVECAQCEKKGHDTGPNKLLRCGQCLVTHYCSKNCQKKHWKAEHKVVCRKGPTMVSKNYLSSSARLLTDLLCVGRPSFIEER